MAAAGGDAAARDRLVEHFMPAIAGVARRYRGSPAVERDELIQEGVVGLLRALERFDVTMGTPFWAYAKWWVRQAMQQLVAEMTRPVVLSDRALRQLARVKGAQQSLRQATRCEPSINELCECTGLSRTQIESLRAVERPPRSLEEPLGADDDGAGKFEDLLADPGAEDGYDHVEDHFEVETVRELAKDLDERERTILNSHYGLGCQAQTLREIAGVLGLSPERVRQIEERGLAKLRAAVDAGEECVAA
jgi:RNA polymerase sigma factor (sigma-70 family)